MIAIINYKAGNLGSVSQALNRLGTDCLLADTPEQLEQADGIIFPGVGHARPAMQSLAERRIDRWLRQTQKPVLGICLGMQLLFESSEEGNTKGLGIMPGTLRKFDDSKAKVPHMGWNTIQQKSDHPLLKSLSGEEYFYFVHSFYAPLNRFTLASCHYINGFSAVVARGNIMGVQFHPEKSGEAGSVLLRNFLDVVKLNQSAQKT